MQMMNESLKEETSGLLPYHTIVAAVGGDVEAMQTVLRHFDSYIMCLARRQVFDEELGLCYDSDQDIVDRLQIKLIQAVMKFNL